MNLQHFFIPHKKNNYHPYLLRNLSLFILSAFTVISFNAPGILKGNVLGIGSNITKDEIVRLTNEQRANVGMGTLNYNPQLETAAILKAQDMFAKNYWAHNSPDGETPWSFFSKAGYSFKFAGENLARDFDNSSGVVSGWMGSEGHRANILNPNFTDIGIGIMNGTLNGSETTLVVQMFGTTTVPIIAASTPKAEDVPPDAVVQGITNPIPLPTDPPIAISLNQEMTSSNSALVKSEAKSSLKEKKVVKVTPNLIASFTSSPIYEKIGFLLLLILFFAFVVDRLHLNLLRIKRPHTGHSNYHILTLGGLIILFLILIQGSII